MTATDAAGERFLATGELMWLPEIAQLLRDELGEAAARVSTEVFEDDEALVGLVPGIGRRNTHTTAKARDLLGWTPRPGREAVLDCAGASSPSAPCNHAAVLDLVPAGRRGEG